MRNDGQRRQNCKIIEGNGYCKSYHPNGELSSIYFYNDSVKNGPYCRFYIDGNIESKGTYKNGLLSGKRITFNVNGDTSSVFEFVNGEIVSQIVYKNDVPVVKSNYNYKKDTIYNADGSVRVIDW